MTTLPPREAMEFDIVIVGAGLAGLAAAIRIKQLTAECDRDDVEDPSQNIMWTTPEGGSPNYPGM